MASAPLRPRTARVPTAAAALAAAAIGSLTWAASASAVPAPDPPAPTCGAPAGAAFPLDTRLHGGPEDYPAGGGLQEWKLDLTNTTAGPCSGIHPVLVLTDSARALRPEQIRFEFYDDGAARWRPVAFEATEEAENVGAFTGFDGFSVPAGRTLTVPVRLAFRAGTVPDEVVVNAAIVQRRGADGDWVGESGDYRLTVGPPDPSGPGDPNDPAPDTSGTADPAAPSRPPGTPVRPPGPDAAARGDLGLGGSDHELAHTGRESETSARWLAPLAVALVIAGAVLVRHARRRPRHR
ncbi:hypothetical protein [Streptomyces venezuelae]|uniref:hypothetical protein n=1 Tax=Streptomyces venezuelae TaxID=54571 RepID=UPI00278BF05E|nr:hypothetical protein [Streptomyces venezuelae]